MLAAALLSFFDVVALTARESDPRPGRIALPVLVGVGWGSSCTSRRLRSASTARCGGGAPTCPPAALVGTGGIFFRATRQVGSFSQVWPMITAIVNITVLHAIDRVRTWISESVAARGSGWRDVERRIAVVNEPGQPASCSRTA